MKKYKTLVDVAAAFKSGELSKDEWVLMLDNDDSYLCRVDDDDGEEFPYTGGGYHDLEDACKAAGIPCEWV